MLFNLGAFPAARHRLEEAVAIARSASDHRLIVRCLHLLGAILYKRATTPPPAPSSTRKSAPPGRADADSWLGQ